MLAGVAIKTEPALIAVGAMVEMNRMIAAAAKKAFVTQLTMSNPMVVGAINITRRAVAVIAILLVVA